MAYLITYQKYRAFDNNGDPLSGGKVYTYESRTTTPKTTYTDSTEETANANPVILDSRGEADIWLNGTYTIVLEDSDGVQIDSQNDITGIGSLSDVLDQWVDSGITPTYVSATSFTMSGDQTSDFEVGRRIKSTNSGGTVYSTIVGSSYSDPNTTVTTVNDESASLDSGLSAVSLSILSVSNHAYPNKELYHPLAITHDMASDADYTLTDKQNIYGRIIITDTGTNLTADRNIVVSTTEREFIAQNDTAYTLTFKTSAGTGIPIAPNEYKILICDGTNVEKTDSGSITEETAQATTSGSTVSFTGIPSGVKKIIVQFVGVSSPNNVAMVIKLGDSGGLESTGYTSTSCTAFDSASPTIQTSTSSFLISYDVAPVITGNVILSRENSSSNTWTISGILASTSATTDCVTHIAGSKSLSEELDRLQIAASTFDAGEVNISYES